MHFRGPIAPVNLKCLFLFEYFAWNIRDEWGIGELFLSKIKRVGGVGLSYPKCSYWGQVQLLGASAAVGQAQHLGYCMWESVLRVGMSASEWVISQSSVRLWTYLLNHFFLVLAYSFITFSAFSFAFIILAIISSYPPSILLLYFWSCPSSKEPDLSLLVFVLVSSEQWWLAPSKERAVRLYCCWYSNNF